MSAVEDQRKSSDRVFLNLLIILTGVVVAYGASVLVGLLRHATPWSDISTLTLYVAWVGVTLLTLLVFVSQAFESGEGPVALTVVFLGITIATGTAQFVAFGTLDMAAASGDPMPPDLIPLWFLAVVGVDLLAAGAVTIALRQSRSKMYPGTAAMNDEPKVMKDRRAALLHAT